MFFDSKTLILIGGATASGKTRAAVELAIALEGAVLNADSMQLYRDLPILTAMPTLEQRHSFPHYLFGILDHAQTSSAIDWLNLIEKSIENEVQTNACIVVGGTGLYLSSLMYGLSPIPDIDENLRYQIRQQGKALVLSSGQQALYECVVMRDPLIRGRIHPHHTQRLLRAWEVMEQTGRSIILWQQEPRQKNNYAKSILFVLDLDKDLLQQNIRMRCEEMIKAGVIDEVKMFLEKTKGVFCPLYKAIGLSEIRQYIDGHLTLDEMIEQIVQATKQYAKRQQTWFRTQYPASDVCLIPAGKDIQSASIILKKLYSLQL